MNKNLHGLIIKHADVIFEYLLELSAHVVNAL